MTADAIHTPACMTHVIGDAAFVGDTLFMRDGGSTRADFPSGDAGVLYDSIQRVLSLPDATRLLVCLDYGPDGPETRWETRLGGRRRRTTTWLRSGPARPSWPCGGRATRPFLPSLQVNMRAGAVPTVASGRPMLKLPVNAL